MSKNGQGVRFDHLEDSDAERIGLVFKVEIQELWYTLGRAGQELDAGKLTEGLFVAVVSSVTGHAVIIRRLGYCRGRFRCFGG